MILQEMVTHDVNFDIIFGCIDTWNISKSH